MSVQLIGCIANVMWWRRGDIWLTLIYECKLSEPGPLSSGS